MGIEELQDENNDEEKSRNQNSCCWKVDECCYQDGKQLFQKKTALNFFILLLKAIGFFFCAFIPIWNITKLPYYLTTTKNQPATSLTYDAARCNNTDGGKIEYWCHGTEGSINIGHWAGYRSGKIISDPITFLSIHVTIGATLLLLSSSTIFYPSLRRKYGYPFFICSILLGAHTLPVCFAIPNSWKT